MKYIIDSKNAPFLNRDSMIKRLKQLTDISKLKLSLMDDIKIRKEYQKAISGSVKFWDQSNTGFLK